MDITFFIVIVLRDVLDIHIQYMFSIGVQCLSLREPPQYWTTTTTTVDLLCCLSSTWWLTLISAPASPCGPVNNHTRRADQLSCSTSLCQVKMCERQMMRYLTLPVVVQALALIEKPCSSSGWDCSCPLHPLCSETFSAVILHDNMKSAHNQSKVPTSDC